MSQQNEQMSITSTSDIAILLQYQDKLLNIIHSNLYSHTVDDDAIVKFQINYVIEMNQAWKKMIDDLLFRLVRQRISYQSVLRDHFHKVLTVDFLPFLRINRHELTQVSLFGFDIYVQPLSAILQIINRIDGQKHIISQHIIKNVENIWWDKPRDIWQSIKLGWDQFIYQGTLTKISINVYLLKQYLKIAAKSLVKRDKQIIFTGCTNLFTQIVPALKQNRQIWLLVQISQLNNQLYQFHPSFNYSHFYSLLLPLQNQFQPIFKAIKIIGQKSLNANILTPLLFAILLNRQTFLQFIDQIDHQFWAVYLNGLVFGLICNFKTRILQYEEVMEILGRAIYKLGILDQLQTYYFVGELDKQWIQTRDFFISALKSGYNVGELQTWHPTDSQTIQQRLIKFTKNSLLMHSSFPPNTAIQIYFPNGYQQQIEICLQQLTGSLLKKSQLINNFSPNISQAVQISNHNVHQLLKISHLLQLCKSQQNINCICYMLSFLNHTKNITSVVLQNRLIQIGIIYYSLAIQYLQKQHKSRQYLKQVLFEYIKRNKTVHKIQQVINLFLLISTPKQSLPQILSLIPFHPIQQQPNICKIIAANIITLYCPDSLGPSTKVKTFDKQYQIQIQIININNKLNSCIGILIDKLIIQNLSHAQVIILWMIRYCKWLMISILNFPVSFRHDSSNKQIGNKIQSFSIWLITNPNYYGLLIELLSHGISINNDGLVRYIEEICMCGIMDQILVQINIVINQLNQLQDNIRYLYIIQLLQLFVILYQQSKTMQSNNYQHLLRKIMKLYIKSLQKLDSIIVNIQDIQIVKRIIKSLFQLYCPLLDTIMGNQTNCRKWRANMKKICLNSLDINVEHVQNIREFQLPTIRKDKGFLIHNAIQQNKDNLENMGKSIEKIRNMAQQLYRENEIYLVEGYFRPKQQQYLSPEYLLTFSDIKNLQISQLDSILGSKQYLLPPLSAKMVKKLISIYTNLQMTIADLLSLTPSNHHKLTQYAILSTNKQVLLQISLSKQATQNLLPQICSLLSQQQLNKITQTLDKSSKQNISDNFNLQLVKQQYYNQITKQKQMIIDLSGSLAFLIVRNQSNWRYMNQIVNEIAHAKGNGMNTIPSLMLEYFQYVKITYKSNKDYEYKVKSYLEIVAAYTNLLTQKYNYLEQLRQQLQSAQKEQKISAQQLYLYRINQLAYISSICQACNFKDFLNRAAYFRSEISSFQIQLNQFNNIYTIIDQIQGKLYKINQIVNKLADGNIKCSDFIYSYRLCSDISYQNYKITLGQNLQAYSKIIKKQLNPNTIYIPTNAKLYNIIDYISKNYHKQQHHTQNIKLFIQNIKKQSAIQLINEKYKQLQNIIVNTKTFNYNQSSQRLELLAIDNDKQDTQSQQKQINQLLYNFGIMYNAMLLTQQKIPKIDKLVQILKERNVLSWQILKNYDMEAYHHIKAILIDQQIQSRKIKFVFKEKLLIPQGLNIQVNKANRQKYCNLIAKASIGERLLNRANIVVKGMHSIV